MLMRASPKISTTDQQINTLLLLAHNAHFHSHTQALANAGATITVGTWPPVLGIFQKSLASGKFDEDMILNDGSKMVIEKIYPLDAVFDTSDDVPADVLANKR